MAARLDILRAVARPMRTSALARPAGLAWPRLPAWAELATLGAGYAAYALVRLAVHSARRAAFGHAIQLGQAERHLHLTVEPYLNHLARAHPLLAEAGGITTGFPLHHHRAGAGLAVPAQACGVRQLRSALVLATTAANVVFWAWPAAPPRFPVPGMTDILVTRDILGAAHPHGTTRLVNLYAAMPSLHVAWAAGAPPPSSPPPAPGGVTCWIRPAGSPSLASAS